MDHKTRLQRYATLFYAALIVIAISVGSLVYSLLKTGPNDIETVVITTDEFGTVYVDPVIIEPTTPPGEFPTPTTPPTQ